MKISLKTFNKIRLVFVFIIAFLISQSIILENYIFPIFIVIIWSLVLFFLRSKVSEIIADERDYLIAWKSAILSIQIFSWISVISMFLFYYFKWVNPVFEVIAQTLWYLVCVLMLLYSFIFSFLTRQWKFDRKLVFYSFFIALLVWFFAFAFFSKVFMIQVPWEKIDYKIEKVLDVSCKKDSECETPWEYLIRSNCPYTSKCIQDKCSVICPNF